MKNHFKITLTISIFIYCAVYAITSFICWHLYNPFYWITQIPKMECADRFILLFFFVFYQCCLHISVHEYLKKLKTK